MALNQRRVKILHLIREDGHAKVQDLSKIFNVTDVTIRQDLEALEQMGYIQREHGGAFAERSRVVCQDRAIVQSDSFGGKERNRSESYSVYSGGGQYNS